MKDTRNAERIVREKKSEITCLFLKADAEFANGVNALGNNQIATISSVNQNANDLLNQSTRICKKTLDRIDQQGFDSLMLEYEKITRGGK